jgi:tetratricopeptide (TPR) repeat protein
VVAARRQVVRHLSQQYLRLGERDRAETLLITHLNRFPTDQDALYRLMKLLIEAEGFREALVHYTHCERLLNEQGRQPAPPLQELARRLLALDLTGLAEARARHLQQSLHRPHPIAELLVVPPSLTSPLSPETLLPFSKAIKQGILKAVQELGEQERGGAFRLLAGQETAYLSPPGGEENTLAHFDPTKRETLRHIASMLGATTLSSQIMIDAEPWERLSRAAARPSLFTAAAFDHFEHLLGEAWELSNLNDLETAQQVLSSFLPKIIAIPPRQVNARMAFLASQGLRLQSVLVHHRLRIAEKVLLCEQSVDYARAASDSNALVEALMELAVAYKYSGQPEQWFKLLQEALYYCPQASPLVQSQLYFKSALAFAFYAHKREAQSFMQMAFDVFPDHPELDPAYTLADSSIYTFSRDAGRAYLELGQTSDASRAFETYISQKSSSEPSIPERVWLEMTNGLCRVAILEKDLENYAHFLREALAGALALGSKKRFSEAYTTFREEMPATWLSNSLIQSIAEQYSLARA